MSETKQTCPRCSNQCPQDDLKCPRGEAYFANQNSENGAESRSFDGHKKGDHHHGKPNHGHKHPGHHFDGMDQDSLSYLVCKTGHILGHMQGHGNLNDDEIFGCLNTQEQQELKTLLEKVLTSLKARKAGAHHHDTEDQ